MDEVESRVRRPEQDLQRALFEDPAWRRAPGTFSFHVPLGGWRSPIEARFMKGLGVVPGIPDVLSPAQIEAHKAMRAAGAEVAIVVGINDALEQLKAWNLLRGST